MHLFWSHIKAPAHGASSSGFWAAAMMCSKVPCLGQRELNAAPGKEARQTQKHIIHSLDGTGSQESLGQGLRKCLPVDIFQRNTQSNPSSECEFRQFVGVEEGKQFHGCPAPRWHLTRLKRSYFFCCCYIIRVRGATSRGHEKMFHYDSITLRG